MTKKDMVRIEEDKVSKGFPLINAKESNGGEHKVSIYAIYDSKANMYDIPFFCRNDLFADRKFRIDMQKNMDNMLGLFYKDFELHLLGEFDQDTGAFDNCNRVLRTGEETMKAITNTVEN